MGNEQIFSRRAGHYEKARPGYAPGVTELVLRELLHPGDVIADVGSGTGIFAGEWIRRGYEVFCVEPNGEMRQKAEARFAGNPLFHSVAAPAEATGLPEHSIDLITAASAFHWFDAARFTREARRILRPGGVLFTVINARDDRDPFTRAQHEICKRYCPGFTSLHHGLDESIPRFEVIFGDDLHRADFDFPLTYTREQFIGRSLSSSYAPDPDTEARDAYIRALEGLLEEYAPGAGEVTVPNASVAYWGKVQ